MTQPLSSSPFALFQTQTPAMLAVLEQAQTFARLNAPLLIQGETGTGKDRLAKACHQESGRAAEKFIAVNCAGLPADEAETEMFGHHGGGKESVGFFEYADKGTVLLDSVAELSLEMQGKLLRFLNDGSFRRVGADREIQVDVRVICTSQKPLLAWVKEGKMREDLYHRLNVLTLDLPPLRERLADIPLLAEHFISQITQQLGISPLRYAPSVLEALKQHRWSGNVRELHNVIYRACSLAQQGELSVQNLQLPDFSYFSTPAEEESGTLEEMMNRYEAALLQRFYRQYPSTRKLAQRLGISHTAVANKLRSYGISQPNGSPKE